MGYLKIPNIILHNTLIGICCELWSKARQKLVALSHLNLMLQYLNHFS